MNISPPLTSSSIGNYIIIIELFDGIELAYYEFNVSIIDSKMSKLEINMANFLLNTGSFYFVKDLPTIINMRIGEVFDFKLPESRESDMDQYAIQINMGSAITFRTYQQAI